MRNRHLACLHARLARPMEAEFAMPQRISITHPYRRSKHPAGHRSPCIHIATARLRIERRTSRVICKLLKLLSFVTRLPESPGCRISGKLRPINLNPHPRPALDLSRQRRLRATQRLHPRTQPRSIKRIDRKCPIAALRTPHPALEPLPRTHGSVRQRPIHDLHQF